MDAVGRTDADYFTDEHALKAVPAIGNPVEFWLLGSTADSARLAASLGLAYAFAHHLNPQATADATRTYREGCAAPELIVSVSTIVAETDARAEWLAGPIREKVARRRRGERILLPSPEDATSTEPVPGLLIGAPDTVRKQLGAIADETGADELMITTPVHGHADRRRSYELLTV